MYHVSCLDGVLVCEQVDNFECVRNDSDGHQLLSIVTALHHQAANISRTCSAYIYIYIAERDTPVHQSLNNGHLCLLELLLGVTTGGVGDINSMADLDIIRQRDILHFDARTDGFR
jgi:hypothetical protein